MSKGPQVYITQPKLVEVMEFTEKRERVLEIKNWLRMGGATVVVDSHETMTLQNRDEAGYRFVMPGDFIVRDSDGRFLIESKESLELLYSKV